MKTNEVIISKIDRTNPTVTPVSENITINVGDSNEISSYFTYTANGIAPIESVTYINISDKNKEVENTNTLPSGTNIIQCIVTKESGATETATITIEVETTDLMPALSYGATVTNYVTPSGDPDVEWRIFYADESNIYLIASDYISYDYAPASENNTLCYYVNKYQLSMNDVVGDYAGSADITDERIIEWIHYVNSHPSETNSNIRAVAFMLDTDIWSAKYANTEYAEYAIGGPTLELWIISYAKTHLDKYVTLTTGADGYKVKWITDSSFSSYITGVDDYNELYYTTNSISKSKASQMWIASPSAAYAYELMCVDYNGRILSYPLYIYRDGYAGFRPIVCLNSDVQLEKQSDGTYLIK